ncbi:MAG: hypothetical protein QOJ65_2087 [Fimbriimonadaceae bacterium]|jgi:hypothetical protein|nr:hypothetical protein [Fimbriimonadaceae bacterium]
MLQSSNFRALLVASFVSVLSSIGLGQTDVLTQHNDNYRTGWYDRESKLSPATVNWHTFGKVLTRTIDGRSMGQVLAVSDVSIPGVGTKNCIYVTTSKNTVYCWDATSSSATAPYWTRNLGPYVPSADVAAGVKPYVGIVGTPVIDRAANALYVVAYNELDGVISYRLHALDIRTGLSLGEMPIQGGVLGTGEGSIDGLLRFDPRKHLQRAGLLLQNGKIIICFASHDDQNPFHGWVFQVNQATLTLDAVFCTTPNSGRGGIWMSGAAPASDGQAIYVTSGNGRANATSNNGYGDSALKLMLDGRLSLADWFAPHDSAYLDQYDLDYGSTGVMLIPGTNYMLTGSKASKMFLIDGRNMGRWNSISDNVVQSWIASNEHIHCSPIWWSTSAGAFAYVWGEDDVIRQFQWAGNHFITTPYAVGNYKLVDGHMPGGMLSVSSYNGDPATGIVWALHIDHALTPTQVSSGPAVLRAFRADNVGVELWNSEIFDSWDSIGSFAKFSPPTVAFGRVYVPTSEGKVRIFGLVGTKRATMKLSNLSQRYNGDPRRVTVTTDPSGLTGVTVTYNGSTTAPRSVGTYAVVATLSNALWKAPPVEGTLVITRRRG